MVESFSDVYKIAQEQGIIVRRATYVLVVDQVTMAAISGRIYL